MTKYEWETELKKCMSRLPRAEQDRVLAYYNEVFADRADEGMSEKQIINEFGNPSDVAFKIMTDYGMDEREPEKDNQIAPPDFYVKKSETKTEVPPDFWAGKSGKTTAMKGDKDAKTARKEERAEIRDIKREDRQARHEERKQLHAEKKDEREESRGFFATVLFLAELILFGGVFIGLVTVLWSLIVSVYAIGYSFAIGSIYALICVIMPGQTIGVILVEIAVVLLLIGVSMIIIPNTAKIAKFGVNATRKGWGFLFGWYTKKRNVTKKEVAWQV